LIRETGRKAQGEKSSNANIRGIRTAGFGPESPGIIPDGVAQAVPAELTSSVSISIRQRFESVSAEVDLPGRCLAWFLSARMRRNPMEYKGVEYTVVQLTEGVGWQYEIDRALKNRP
jgi:hypothetical protein